MLDARTFDVHGTASTGEAPAHVVVTPDGRTAYTTNGADDTVTVIDTETMKTVATIRVGAHDPRPAV